MAASCRASWRPMAPTPTTTAWSFASRSGGTRPRWRTSRSGKLVDMLVSIWVEVVVVVEGARVPVVELLQALKAFGAGVSHGTGVDCRPEGGPFFGPSRPGPAQHQG